MFGKKINPKSYPKRRWTIVAPSGAGKSLFSMQLKTPIAVIDADGQIEEAVFLSGNEEVFTIAEEGRAEDMRNVDAIRRILKSNMPKSNVGTIVVDSVTPIIKRIITDLQHDNAVVKIGDFNKKSQAMHILADSVTEWGTDVLLIYHYHNSVDNKGNKSVNTTISELELVRLQKFINARLEIVQENDKYGIKVLWSRNGRYGDILWDDVGNWVGMPEKIESYMYDSAPKVAYTPVANKDIWTTSTDAIAWAWELSQGAKKPIFNDAQHAKNSFSKLYAELKDELVGEEVTSGMAFAAWKDYVNNKLNSN